MRISNLLGGATAALLICGGTTFAVPITSPANDLLLSGVADIDGGLGGWQGDSAFSGATKVNDGNRDGSFGDGHLAHTTTGPGNPPVTHEMEVTLSAPTTFGSVILFDRTDCCGSRIDGGGSVPYTLNIYDGSTLAYTSTQTFTPDLVDTNISGQTLVLSQNVVGDRVQIVQNNNDYMNIAEIEAYAPTPEPASLGLIGFGAMGLLARRRRA